ncbi:hypothetical protein AVEN_192095-1 [Araneus ventricosus]|uniref:Uncharacterized protein n=1 Tax=Araneus ventricosus TaxID=182803 RepID=A0A4Y2B9C6_ARAVE|nr:hypothetical protein AVEN_192095-1 [Araneus ventricosus]
MKRPGKSVDWLRKMACPSGVQTNQESPLSHCSIGVRAKLLDTDFSSRVKRSSLLNGISLHGTGRRGLKTMTASQISGTRNCSTMIKECEEPLSRCDNQFLSLSV